MAEQHEVRYAESALDPELPVVDAHQHMWEDGHYSPADLKRDITAGHDIVSTVFIECSTAYRTAGPEQLAPVGETEWLLRQRKDGIAAGMIGFADMYRGSRAAETLEAHLEVAGDVFKGIRHSVAWDKSPNVNNGKRNAPEHALLDPTFQAGVAELAKAGLIFETWCYFHQLDEIAELARTFPDMSVVLDHLGGPVVIGPYAGHRAEMLDGWRHGLKRAAEQENVFLKLGGIGYPSFVEAAVMAGPRTSEWLADYWAPEILFAIETFGPDRCMFESNYPADSPLCDYVTLWNIFKRIGASLSTEDRQKVFQGTAQRAYWL